MEETENKNSNVWMAIAIIAVICFVISLIVNISQNDRSKSNNEYYAGQLKYYADNYDVKCQTGTTKYCLGSEQQVSYCTKDQYASCYNNILQTSVVCNKADDMIASCVPKDYTKYATCQTGEYATCLKDGTRANNCDVGYTPSCLDKTKWGVWTGSYSYSCSVGQTASCK